jgi:signal transduction histidine kinase
VAAHGVLSMADTLLIAYFFTRFLGNRHKRFVVYVLVYLAYFAVNFYLSAFTPDRVYRGVLSIVFPLLAVALYKGNLIERAFAAVLLISFRFVPEPFVAVTISWLNNLSFIEIDNSILFYISGGVATAISCAIAVMSVRKRGSQFFSMPKSHYAILMGIVSACTFLAYVDVTLILQNQKVTDFVNVLTETFVCALPVLIFIVFRHFQHYAGLRLRQGMVEGQLNQTEKMFEMLEQQHREMRELKHDIVGQLGLVREMANDTDGAGVSRYIEKYTQTILPRLDVFFTGETSIDSLISLKKKKAEESGIEFRTNIPCFRDLKINPVELTNILINALDNAIDACSVLPQTDERWIELNMRTEDDYLDNVEFNIDIIKYVGTLAKTIQSVLKE